MSMNVTLASLMINDDWPCGGLRNSREGVEGFSALCSLIAAVGCWREERHKPNIVNHVILLSYFWEYRIPDFFPSEPTTLSLRFLWNDTSQIILLARMAHLFTTKLIWLCLKIYRQWRSQADKTTNRQCRQWQL